MKQLFDLVSMKCSRITTNTYSTSFSLGIRFLNRRFHNPIYAIYGFVRFADEIVDSFHAYDKMSLLGKFRKDTYEALDEKISLNPILNAFQDVVHRYGIERELVDTFLKSMEMDLDQKVYNTDRFKEYVLGSAEVVGLMCLKVFTEENTDLYRKLIPSAMKLGAAFQKVNFLRDIKADYEGLGRSYFPQVDLKSFSTTDKKKIEDEIAKDFEEALKGIRQLPVGARQGVYMAYVYYKALFAKIKDTPAEEVTRKRIRIPNGIKFGLMLHSMLRHKMNYI